MTRKGMRIAMLAYSEFPMGHASLRPRGAVLAMQRDIEKARRDAHAVVVNLHWGEEYSPRPTPWQRRVGHRAIDAGAALVVGHHPHVPQGVEIYRGRAIAYSLGNFLFDQPMRHTREGLALDWFIDEAGNQSMSLLAVGLRDRKTYRPYPLAGAPARRVLWHVAGLSEKLGTQSSLHKGRLLIKLPNTNVISGSSATLALSQPLRPRGRYSK